MDYAERSTGIVTEIMCGLQAAQHLCDQVDRNQERDAVARLAVRDQVAEWFAVDPLHGQVQRATLFSELDGLHHVRVLDQAGDSSLFEQHALQALAVLAYGEQ